MTSVQEDQTNPLYRSFLALYTSNCMNLEVGAECLEHMLLEMDLANSHDWEIERCKAWFQQLQEASAVVRQGVDS